MDPLEHRLREELRADRWDVTPDADALRRVHAGAARRRMRRKAVMVTAAVTVLVAGFGGIGYVVSGGGPTFLVAERTSDSAGGGSAEDTGLEAAPREADPPGAHAPQGADSDAERRSGEKAGELPSESNAEPPRVLDGGAPVPSDFTPVSMTAADVRTYWLLGTTDGGRASLAVTQDGGATFRTESAPSSAVARGDNEVGAGTVSDVRFAGDGQTGWAYGGALWATRDGGRTWAQDNSVPGLVKRLEIGGGSAYALVDTDSGWTLWRTLLGDSSTWQQLGVEANSPGDLAVTGQLVAVTDKDAEGTTVWVSTDDGTTFETYPTPCHQDLDAGRLSATIGSLWLRCATGTAATIHVSSDAGASWSDVPTGEPAVPSSGSAVGARDASRAVVAARGEARSIGADGTTKAEVPGLGSPAFAGFTTDQVGYILDLQGRFFRTEDGGATWSQVTIN